MGRSICPSQSIIKSRGKSIVEKQESINLNVYHYPVIHLLSYDKQKPSRKEEGKQLKGRHNKFQYNNHLVIYHLLATEVSTTL